MTGPEQPMRAIVPNAEMRVAGFPILRPGMAGYHEIRVIWEFRNWTT